MGTESPSNQKTEEELFAEVSQALASGGDVNSIVSKAELVGEEPKEESSEEEVVEEQSTTTEETQTTEVPADGGETPPAATPSDDWEANLPDNVKAQIKLLREEKLQAEHRVKSELGRVPFLQRKVEELSRQLSAPRVNPPKDTAATKTSVNRGKFEQKLAEARAVDPALAELIEALRDDVVLPLREEFSDEVNQTKALFVNKEHEQLWHSEKAKLLSIVPEADAVFAHPLYKQWKSEVSDNMRALAGSIHADEVVVALGEFYKYAEKVAPELVVKPTTTTPATTTTTETPNPLAAKVASDRARKLNSPAPSTAATGPKGGDGIPENPEDLFKYVTEKIRKGESYKV